MEREWANDAVARRFSLAMNAATSKWGALCDIIFGFGVSAVIGLPLVLVAHFRLWTFTWVIGCLAVLPPIICLVANLAMRRARDDVVTWLASLPFPIENMNALLVGFGESFELHFADKVPTRDTVMQHFGAVSEDVFVLETLQDQRVILSRLGVIISKHNPQRQAYVRYSRFREVVERSLRPLHATHPIAKVQVV